MNQILVSTFCLAALAAFTAQCVRADEPITVTPVSFSQNSRTQEVTVKYNLANNGNAAFVTLDVLTNNISIGLENIKTVSGDITQYGTNLVAPGDGKTIVWKARSDWRNHLATNATVRVTAYYTNHLDSVPGIYMDIDLSGGPNAASYPVNYTLQAPNPLTDASCASNHLWLRRIEAGTFIMGAPDDEVGHQNMAWMILREKIHTVKLTKAFFAGVFAVTRQQYALVTGTDVSDRTISPSVLCPENKVSYDEIRGTNDTSNLYNWPTTTAVAEGSFMGRIRAKTGFAEFDLPTEAQWEYACRAGTRTALYNGCNLTNVTTDANLGKIAWYADNSGSISHPVGQKVPNAWGLYDMLGNIWEWCLDWDSSPLTGTVDPTGPNTSTWRVRRGGHYRYTAYGCRASYSERQEPNVKSSIVGFRLFLTMP